jgi:LysM repeat protein
MKQSNDQRRQRVSDNPEYRKFAALVVVAMAAILVVAVLTPLLIGGRAPLVLGLEGAPARAEDEARIQAIEAAPTGSLEEAPEALTEPPGAAGLEQADQDTGQSGSEAAVEVVQHEVQPGETLFQVADLYGVTVQEIAAANHLVNPLEVQAGTVLIIPLPR